jgi:phenylacetate-CoA ligase
MTRSILDRLTQNPDAPRWNHRAGDRLDDADRRALEEFRAALRAEPRAWRCGPPPETLLARVRALREKSADLRRRIPAGIDLERDWETIPTISREDVATRVEELIPDDADLERLIVYRTAGTTGHALLVPHDARATGAYQPLIELALELRGVRLAFDPDAAACFLVGAQARTVTYPTTLSAWGGAGFAKLNLRATEWPSPESAARYFQEFAPPLLTGDPISFAEMLRLNVGSRPAALLSTAVALSRGLQRRLQERYGAPVIDWYSLTETGPIACGAPDGRGYLVLPHDLHVEALGPDGRRVKPGERGEITVTGGRNPFLPLVRYRTGDWGRLEFPADGGRPRLLDLEGRKPVVFRAADGSAVNPVDVSRVLRELPLVQHEFVQRADFSCELTARPIGGVHALDAATLEAALRPLFGAGARIEVRLDAALGDRAEGGKTSAYRSELPLED